MQAQASFPRAPLLGAAALILLALLGAGLGRLAPPAARAGSETALLTRDLRFTDRPDGAIAIADARDGRLLDLLAPGSNGFLRATLRGLARERHRDSLGPSAPFRVTEWPDGRLTLDDPATGSHVELRAFGETNAAVFARLLTLQGAAP